MCNKPTMALFGRVLQRWPQKSSSNSKLKLSWIGGSRERLNVLWGMAETCGHGEPRGTKWDIVFFFLLAVCTSKLDSLKTKSLHVHLFSFGKVGLLLRRPDTR